MQQLNVNKNKWLTTTGEYLLLGICIALIYWILAPDKDRLIYSVNMNNLMGVWTTTHPRYQDRYLQLSEETVTFGRGGAAAGHYTIQSFDTEQIKEGTLVKIIYVDEESTANPLNLIYVAQNGGIIWMTHQKQVIWRRTSTVPLY